MSGFKSAKHYNWAGHEPTAQRYLDVDIDRGPANKVDRLLWSACSTQDTVSGQIREGQINEHCGLGI